MSNRRRYDKHDVIHEIKRVKGLIGGEYLGDMDTEQQRVLHEQLDHIHKTFATYISDNEPHDQEETSCAREALFPSNLDIQYRNQELVNKILSDKLKEALPALRLLADPALLTLKAVEEVAKKALDAIGRIGNPSTG